MRARGHDHLVMYPLIHTSIDNNTYYERVRLWVFNLTPQRAPMRLYLPTQTLHNQGCLSSIGDKCGTAVSEIQLENFEV